MGEVSALRGVWCAFLGRPAARTLAQYRPVLRKLAPGQLGQMLLTTPHADAFPAASRLSSVSISFGGRVSTGDEQLTRHPCASRLKEWGHNATAARGHVADDLTQLSDTGAPTRKEEWGGDRGKDDLSSEGVSGVSEPVVEERLPGGMGRTKVPDKPVGLEGTYLRVPVGGAQAAELTTEDGRALTDPPAEV